MPASSKSLCTSVLVPVLGRPSAPFPYTITSKPSTPSTMRVDNPQQTNVVGENSSPAIYTPSHNIALTPRIYVMPEQVFAPASSTLLTPPDSDKTSLPENIPKPKRAYTRRACGTGRVAGKIRAAKSKKLSPTSSFAGVEVPVPCRPTRKARRAPQSISSVVEQELEPSPWHMDVDEQEGGQPGACAEARAANQPML